MKQKTTFLHSLLLSVAFIIGACNLYGQTLIAHYKLDGNLLDETTSWNLSAVDAAGTIAYTTGHDGTENGAITGFGTADYLETSTDFSLSGSTARTMTAWMKLSTTVGQTAILGLGLNQQYKKWTFGPQGTKLRVEINGKGYNVPDVLSADTWYHVAVAFDDDAVSPNIKLYVNGGLYSATNNWDNIVNTSLTKLRIGNDYNATPPNRGFKGALDDIRIYSGAMDDDQILSLYNSSSTLGLGDHKLNADFTTYPNPVKERLYFSSKNIASVEIYNLLGSKIASQEVKEGVDMSALSKGVYLIKCQDAEGAYLATVKAVKE